MRTQRSDQSCVEIIELTRELHLLVSVLSKQRSKQRALVELAVCRS